MLFHRRNVSVCLLSAGHQYFQKLPQQLVMLHL
uniref:Uncharacterized protein n=1 Tax=Anguilla anguilla TaxID=7936 RepID=A0A0E9R595_ANGAN